MTPLTTAPISSTVIQTALGARHFETARRLCIAALEYSTPAERDSLLPLLHQALRALGDIPAALQTLLEIEAKNESENAELLLLRAEDYYLLASDHFYRDSPEKRAGLTLDEYQNAMRAAALAPLEAAAAGLQSDQKFRAAKLFRELGHADKAAALPSEKNASPEESTPAAQLGGVGFVSGALRFPDGEPVADALVTLGLRVEVEESDAENYLEILMHYAPRIGAQTSLTTRTDEAGRFHFAKVPAARHEFLAVTLDQEFFAVNTRFFAHGVEVKKNQESVFDATIEEWQSAPPREIENPFTENLEHDGIVYRRVHFEIWRNPFHYEFPRQIVSWPLPENSSRDTNRFLLLDSHAPKEPQAVQVSGENLLFFSDLPPLSHRIFALYATENPSAQTDCESRLKLSREGETLIADTGRAQFRFPSEGEIAMPPLLAIRGEDQVWRGRGRWVLPADIFIQARSTRVLEDGPLQACIEVSYQLSNGQNWNFVFIAHEGEAYLLAHETAPAIEGAAFEFSLQEFTQSAKGGRGFLHWKAENGDLHWKSLRAENRELARLQESVAWWIPPCGFGYAFTPDGLEERDYIGVFTTRRGEWKDALFEKLTNGPRNADGTPNAELDWPFPEMVGSMISMITAHSGESGDAWFRFGAFEGERHWGILASSLEENEGPHKEISRAAHKNSSPRLQDFRLWRLDEADRELRPHVVAQRNELVALRRKRKSPAFVPLWNCLKSGEAGGGADASLVFAIEGDPLVAWCRKRELVGVAHIRARMTLLGRDYSDMYSPVGARPITGWAEEYDLLAASGVFTPEEERLVRAWLMLMGHLYSSPDLMNWHYGSRNANFEADRVDVVGAIGLCFHGNPDAQGFLDHAVSLMERSLDVYCTPGSGKWYENPACYYLQASKCRSNLAFHLWRHGICDASKLPRFKEFLRWGILLLTSPRPADYNIMRDGCAALEYSSLEYSRPGKRRVLPPLGDHAELGRFVPEHYAFLSLMYRAQDPQFADELLWAYGAGGLPGSDFGNVPLLFVCMSESDLKPVAAPPLKSRRLEGFGAVLRDGFETENELYVLWKQGPGGYRFQRSEGSFMLFANGKPLIYEGGEAGETWRHSTLSFTDVHTPLAPGRVERFHSHAAKNGFGFDFVQGAHSKILAPGEPVYLSDDCNHRLVEESYRRFAEPNPAVLRSLWRVGEEYLVVHDDLKIAPEILSHWHLHVVADAEEFKEETGHIFRGRFGTDLQVLLPQQNFAQVSIETLPMLEYKRSPEVCFATRHLKLSGQNPDFYIAVLRPLGEHNLPIAAQLLRQENCVSGLRVQGAGVDDWLWFGRAEQNFRQKFHDTEIIFQGRYGFCAHRRDETQIALIDGALLQASGVLLESEGPSLHLQMAQNQTRLTARGVGKARVRVGQKEWSAVLRGEEIEVAL